MTTEPPSESRTDPTVARFDAQVAAAGLDFQSYVRREKESRGAVVGALATVVNMALLSVAMVLAVMATSETAGRAQAMSQVTRREAEEIRSVVKQAGMARAADGSDSDAKTVASSPLEPGSRLIFVQQCIITARGLLERLAMSGDDISGTDILRAVDAALAIPGDAGSALACLAEDRAAACIAAARATKDSLPSPLPQRSLWNPLPYVRTDFLLALIVVACSFIGSVVAALRAGNARFQPVAAALGLASGFIAFISLRGGRAVFMLEMAGETPMFNSYSMAFVGLLVGLFSTKAYQLLSALVDDLHGRITSALAPRQTGEAVHLAPTPKSPAPNGQSTDVPPASSAP
jgi:hypothetical protein